MLSLLALSQRKLCPRPGSSVSPAFSALAHGEYNTISGLIGPLVPCLHPATATSEDARGREEDARRARPLRSTRVPFFFSRPWTADTAGKGASTVNGHHRRSCPFSTAVGETTVRTASCFSVCPMIAAPHGNKERRGFNSLLGRSR